MANYTFSSELVDEILFRADEPTDGTSDYETVALLYLNRAYQALWMGGAEFVPGIHEVWWWLQTEGNFILQPSVETGTVNVTKNNSSVTFSSAPTPLIDTSVTGWFLKITDHADVFKISAHTPAATGATLDTVYTGTTNTTASFKLFKLDYTLPTAAMSIVTPMMGNQDNAFEIRSSSPGQFQNDFPLNLVEEGIPYRFAHLTETTIRFNRYPSDLARVDYTYITQPSDLTNSGSEEPLVPRRYRRVLSLMGSFYVMQDKNDPRRQEVAAEAQALVRQMVMENRARQTRSGFSGWIFPRHGGRDRRGPLRTESGNILG